MRRHGQSEELGVRVEQSGLGIAGPQPDPLPRREGVSLSTQHPSLITHHSSLTTRRRIPALPTSTLLQIVLLAGIFLLNFFPGTDPDLWWHMATGRYIVDTGAIPRVDPFSYTAAGKPWIAHEWLAEVVMYMLYRLGGYLALVLFFGSMVTLAFGIVLRTLRLLGLKAVAAAAITFWAAFMSLFGWDVRPQIFSYLIFSLYLYLLLRSRKSADRWLWLLPCLMILWVNLHAGYVMGLVLLVLFLAGEAINQHSALSTQHSAPSTQNPELRTQNSALGPRRSSFRSYLSVAVATVAATVVNPQGPAMLLYPLSYAGTQNASMKNITEWQSPDFHYYYFFVFGISLMVLMVAPSRKRMDWALVLPLLALTAMSLQSVRVIPFYAIAVAPILATRLAGGRGSEAGGQRAGDGENPEPRTQNPEPNLITHHSSLITHHSPATPWNWLVLGLCLVTMASTLLSDRAQLGPEPLTTEYPVAGVRYLRESGLKGNLLNTFHWGGFLIWSFYPERRVFVDGRPDMYGDQFMEEYEKVQDARPGWKEVLDRYQIEVALVEKDGRTATLLLASGEWQELFRGNIESVLVRSNRQKEN